MLELYAVTGQEFKKVHGLIFTEMRVELVC